MVLCGVPWYSTEYHNFVSVNSAEFGPTKQARMAASRAGTQLSIPPSRAPKDFSVPKLHDEVVRKGSQVKQIQDILMRTHGVAWKTVNVRGTVVNATAKQFRVEWQVGEERPCTDHGKAFWKPPKNVQPEPVSQPPPQNRRETAGPEHEDGMEEEGGRAGPMREEDEEEALRSDGEIDVNDALNCKMGDKWLQWRVSELGATEDQRAKDGWQDINAKVLWRGPLASKTYFTEEDCLHQMLPLDWLCDREGPLGWTNASLPTNSKPFSEYEFVQCIGIIYGRSLTPSGSMRKMWSKNETGFVPGLNVGERFGLFRARFEEWKRYLKIWPPQENNNPYARITYLIDAFNKHRLENFRAGTDICIDESMSKWIPFFDSMPGGIPNLTKIIRKPVGIGAEIKNIADVTTGVMLRLEFQEGKERMETKKFCAEYPKHVALVLRLTEPWHGKGHVVLGDSYFASVQTTIALLERGTYFMGMLKTASAGFPKAFLQKNAWDAGAKRGDTRTCVTDVVVNGKQKQIYGHAWNEPGTEGVPKKILVISCSSTLPADDHIKHRWELDVESGRGVHITRTVPRTIAIKKYYGGANVIDIHNHLRQHGLALEDSVGTNEWSFRTFCTVLGMCEVDAYKVFCLCNDLEGPPGHAVFVDRLVLQLLTNSFEGGPEETEESIRYRLRVVPDSDDEEDDEGVHKVIKYTDYVQQVTGKRKRDSEGHQTRCKVCPVDPSQGRRPKASWVCVKCSNACEKAFGLCGPGSGRDCIAIHQAKFSK